MPSTTLQVPASTERHFGFIEYKHRRLYAAMVSYMDGVVGELVHALHAKGMWGDTLMLFTSDNGGPIYYPGSATNHP